jgi:hypothetical protein
VGRSAWEDRQNPAENTTGQANHANRAKMANYAKLRSLLTWLADIRHPSGMQVIRVARLVLDIPAGLLAARAGLSARELHRIERGLVMPTSTTLRALDQAFLDLMAERLRPWTGAVQ